MQFLNKLILILFGHETISKKKRLKIVFKIPIKSGAGFFSRLQPLNHPLMNISMSKNLKSEGFKKFEA